jgi:hypothetical protein
LIDLGMSEAFLMDFWYNFDNFFLFSASDSTRSHIVNIRRTFDINRRFTKHYKDGTVNTLFKEEIVNNPSVLESIKQLSYDQLKIINDTFQGNKELERTAFEYFGQGLLFDDLLERMANLEGRLLEECI